MTRSQYGLIATSIGIGLAGFLFIKSFVSSVVSESEIALTKTNKIISLDPKHTTCFIFDMRPAGWFLVTEKNRYWVSQQVADGKVEWMEAETTTCYRRYPDRRLGEKIILKNEWYQKRRYR